uniref:Tudor domain-containing protein n=1 Tax=Caenorhabditis tropicalis TaxID=1561998 RepID=A0A1I7TLL3_9PELO
MSYRQSNSARKHGQYKKFLSESSPRTALANNSMIENGESNAHRSSSIRNPVSLNKSFGAGNKKRRYDLNRSFGGFFDSGFNSSAGSSQYYGERYMIDSGHSEASGSSGYDTGNTSRVAHPHGSRKRVFNRSMYERTFNNYLDATVVEEPEELEERVSKTPNLPLGSDQQTDGVVESKIQFLRPHTSKDLEEARRISDVSSSDSSPQLDSDRVSPKELDNNTPSISHHANDLSDVLAEMMVTKDVRSRLEKNIESAKKSAIQREPQSMAVKTPLFAKGRLELALEKKMEVESMNAPIAASQQVQPTSSSAVDPSEQSVGNTGWKSKAFIFTSLLVSTLQQDKYVGVYVAHRGIVNTMPNLHVTYKKEISFYHPVTGSLMKMPPSFAFNLIPNGIEEQYKVMEGWYSYQKTPNASGYNRYTVLNLPTELLDPIHHNQKKAITRNPPILPPMSKGPKTPSTTAANDSAQKTIEKSPKGETPRVPKVAVTPAEKQCSDDGSKRPLKLTPTRPRPVIEGEVRARFPFSRCIGEACCPTKQKSPAPSTPKIVKDDASSSSNGFSTPSPQ